ncbi:peroxin Pex28/29 [Schizosaccharomyces octosporus yFS286]|uniref:Peroxin Pex28/29 n=1 Tax=Schizosaccharomyces octosporus (strain yFS286) TaxID=483514 RepID=S9Q1S5_SCHOY|nr:peroxin Pex28/29 [Schizosaccharomyces octosporus yFS286]EPX73653.1 peroxin Pex28/29 [Schizosaccharomyces octosporus yFS286]
MQNELNPLLLSQNSIRFATRVAIFFIIRDELIEAITWKHPVKSLCLGLTITLLYLHPVSFSVILTLIFVTMMPISLTHDVTTNLRDLQNFMASYSSSYDQLVHFRQNYYHYISPSTISSVLVIFLIVVPLLAFLRISIDRYLPVGLWIILIALHPHFRSSFSNWYFMRQDRLPSLQLRNEVAQVWKHTVEKEGQTMTFYSSSPKDSELPLVPSLELIDPPVNYSWAPDSSWTFHSPNEFHRFVYWNPEPVKLKRTPSVRTS